MKDSLLKLVIDLLDMQKDYKSFDFGYYLFCNPDVNTSGVNPLKHYLRYGWKEGRNPNGIAKTLLVQMKAGIDYRDSRGGVKILKILDRKGSQFAAPTSLRWRTDVAKYGGLAPEASKFISDCINVVEDKEQVAPDILSRFQASFDDAVEYAARFGNRSEPSIRQSQTLLTHNSVERKQGEENPCFNMSEFYSDSAGCHSSGSNVQECIEDIHVKSLISDVKNRLRPVHLPRQNAGEPKISVIVPVYDVDVIWLDQMVASVRAQSYPAWELVLVDDRSTREVLRDRLAQFASEDVRIKSFYRNANGGISAATNNGIELAIADYVALLDCDDVLTHDALEVMWAAIEGNRYPDVLYSDEFKLNAENEPFDFFAKPDWSPSTLINCMYTGHLSIYRKKFLEDIGKFRQKFDYSQDYDLMLRASEQAKNIVHVPRYLYGWRAISQSGSAGGKPFARLSNIAALQSAADRRRWNATAVALPTANKLVFERNTFPKVSLIVPSDSIDNIRETIASIFLNTSYPNFEIVIVCKSIIIHRVSQTVDDKRLVWVPFDRKFNFSAKCNEGSAASKGEFLIFYNDDVRVTQYDWIEGLLDYFNLGNVGAVGPKLLYEDGTIQHAGLVTGVRGIVGTASHGLHKDTNHHFNFAQCVRNVSALSGALLAVRRKIFDEVAGFDAVHTPIKHSDVDLCLRISKRGYSLIYTPYTVMTHIGHSSLKNDDLNDFHRSIRELKDKSEIYLLKRFGREIAEDPYFTKSMRELIYRDSPEPFQILAQSHETRCFNKDVLLVSHDLSASGAPRVLCEIAEMLWEAGNYVVVASPTDGPLRGRLVESGIPVIIDSLAKRSPDWLANFAQDFDHVLINTVEMWRIVSKIGSKPNVLWYLHEGEYINEMARIHSEFADLLRSSPNVAAVSIHTAKFLEEYGCAYELLETGRDPIRCKSRICSNGDVVRFAMFGSYEPRKGQDIAAEAVTKMAEKYSKKIELHFFGRLHDIHFRNELERLYARHKNILLHDALIQEEYEAKMSEFDVIILSSRDDPLPLVAIDAMSLGKPLILSSTTGTSYYLTHGHSALIAEENSAQEICKLMVDLASSRDLRRKIGDEGHKVYLKYFTKSHFEDRLSKIFSVSAREIEADVVTEHDTYIGPGTTSSVANAASRM